MDSTLQPTGHATARNTYTPAQTDPYLHPSERAYSEAYGASAAPSAPAPAPALHLLLHLLLDLLLLLLLILHIILLLLLILPLILLISLLLRLHLLDIAGGFSTTLWAPTMLLRPPPLSPPPHYCVQQQEEPIPDSGLGWAGGRLHLPPPKVSSPRARASPRRTASGPACLQPIAFAPPAAHMQRSCRRLANRSCISVTGACDSLPIDLLIAYICARLWFSIKAKQKAIPSSVLKL